MLGILTLDTSFLRLAGDLGSPATFDFPVRHEVVTGANVDDVVHRRRDTLLPAFVEAGLRLAEAGCAGIATTCGFLVRWQRDLADALRVPVLTSSLLQVPLVERTLPKGRRVGVVTYFAADLGADALAAAGAHPYTPVEGLDPDGYFAHTIRVGRDHVDPGRLADDTVAAARRLAGAHRGLGAIVLECANMPPYRDAVRRRPSCRCSTRPRSSPGSTPRWSACRPGMPGATSGNRIRPPSRRPTPEGAIRRAGPPTTETPMKRLLALAAALGLAVALPASAQTKWDLPSAYPASNFHTENLQQFANDVDKASGGKLKIQLHPNASLFKAPEIKRAVQGGQAQAGEILLVNFENEDPLYGVDGIPFLATSYADSMKLYKASRKALEDRLAKQGMMLLFAVPWPPQGIYSKKPLASGADMKGLKWRAYSPSTAKIAELVGAQPVTVQAAEVPQALATGVMDSMMTSGATGFDSKAYEHVKYYYDTQAWLPKNAIVVNKKAFDALDKATQQALVKAAAEAETRGWKVSQEKNGWYLDQLKAKGMTIAPPSEQLTADLRKVGNYMLAEWLRKAGDDGRKVIDAFRAM